MDILNFISWIRGRRQVTSVDPAKSLLPVGLKDGRRDDEYLAGAISVQDFTAQVASVIPSGAQGPIGPQGVPGPVGPAGLNWQGAWSATGVYVVDDAVGYGGASWFCIANVGPSVTTPDLDPTNWALLASQGATGPQGPQGIQGPQGPSGSGLPGTITSQTQYWTGTQWAPTMGLSTTPSATPGASRIGIGGSTPNTSSYALNVITNANGLRTVQSNSGLGISNQMSNTATSFNFGVNNISANPLIDRAAFFSHNSTFPIKFSHSSTDRLIIQGNGQVVIGNGFAFSLDANLVVKTGDIETEEAGKGLILTSSPSGFRYRITVSDLGVLSTTAVP
jgi:hypothetical protein